MRLHKSSISEFLRSLHQESIIDRVLGVDDGTRALRTNPLQMLFYNQRVIFFGCGGVYLVVLTLLSLLSNYPRHIWMIVIVLWVFWIGVVMVTIVLQGSFRRRLDLTASTNLAVESPRTFYRYLVLDSCFVLCLIAVGRLFNLGLEWFAFLLLGNLVLFSVYIGEGRFFSPVSIAISLLFVLAILLLLDARIAIPEPRWFYVVLNFGPLLSMWAVITFSLSMVSWLRANEHRLTQMHLELLGQYELILSGPEGRLPTDPAKQEHLFEKMIETVLKDLCSRSPAFWYESACLWFVEGNLDRGQLLLPGPSFNFEESNEYNYGIEALSGNKLVVWHSMKDYAHDMPAVVPRLRRNLDAPGALVPLHMQGEYIALLSIYGKDGGLVFLRQEQAFLRSLGSIISSAMQQCQALYRAAAQREMDSLFELRSLHDVFPEASRILKKYLMAEGCMVIFRPNPLKPEMEIVAAEGFSDRIRKVRYEGGRGLTGKCADTGESIRIDDVSSRREAFDHELLTELERSHGTVIRSWMAIPIGRRDTNYGVIKVVNRKSRCTWFTNEDQRLGENLALRLAVIIEKFLYVHAGEAATVEAKLQSERAKQQAEMATKAQKKAEVTALMRQEDLMIITHQLQGPLSAVIGAVTGLLQQSHLPEHTAMRLGYIGALVEDSLAICYGTFTTFAHEAGRQPSFGADRIDAPRELQRLCERLRTTQTRNDLVFSYRRDPDFPTLEMDSNVFTSVMYCLIHNAIKYADADSTVSLECGFERSSGEEAVLKVKSIGEPIQRIERDRIFEKFQRGRVIETTGRHHSGVGLGLWVARQLMRAIGGDLTVELSPQHPRLSVFVVHVPKNNSRY